MSRRIASLTSLAVIVMMALILTAPVVADDRTVMGANPNGWTTHAGPGYELYITPHQDVASTELALLVNYGDDEITLRVTGDNQTITAVTVAPQASRFVQLDFPASGLYQITLATASDDLLTLSKQRTIPPTPDPTPPPPWDDDNWQITPPGPNPWVPVDPPSDPLEYTQAAVDALIAKITLETLLISAGVMAAMVIVGAVVQRKVRFIYPTDVFTIGLLAANVWLIAMVSAGRWDVGFSLWYIVPELAGYFIGYILGARNDDQLIQYISPAARYTWRRATLIYEHDGRQCIADQNNRALLKRLLWNIHHEIDSPTWLEANWDDDAKYRLFPLFKKRSIWVERYETNYTTVTLWWRLRGRKYTTRVDVAYGSQASTADLMAGTEVLDRLRDRVQQLAAENIRLEKDGPRNVAHRMTEIIRPPYEMTQSRIFDDYLALDEEGHPPAPEGEEVDNEQDNATV